MQKETICMKYETLFSLKTKEQQQTINIKLSSAGFAQRVLKADNTWERRYKINQERYYRCYWLGYDADNVNH